MLVFGDGNPSIVPCLWRMGSVINLQMKWIKMVVCTLNVSQRHTSESQKLKGKRLHCKSIKSRVIWLYEVLPRRSNVWRISWNDGMMKKPWGIWSGWLSVGWWCSPGPWSFDARNGTLRPLMSINPIYPPKSVVLPVVIHMIHVGAGTNTDAAYLAEYFKQHKACPWPHANVTGG